MSVPPEETNDRRAYVLHLFESDAEERDVLLISAGYNWIDDREWYEIVGVRDSDRALRARNIHTGTLTWLSSRSQVPLTRGAHAFVEALTE